MRAPPRRPGPAATFARVRQLIGGVVDVAAVSAPVWIAAAAVTGGVAALSGSSAPAVVLVLVVCVLVAVGGVVWCVVPRRRIAAAAADGRAPGHEVTIVAANLWYLNRSMAEAARDLAVDRPGAPRPDVVVVSELGAEAHEVLAGSFRHHEVLSVGGARGHGVYSHLPLERLEDPGLLGQVLRVRVRAATPFVLYGVHMPRPVVFHAPTDGTDRPAACRGAIERLADAARRDAAVVAGDLNLCDRQPAYRRLVAGRIDAMRVVRPRTTFIGPGWRLLAMRIDHVTVPPGWGVSDARVVPIRGSDHRGVRATVCPRPAPH